MNGLRKGIQTIHTREAQELDRAVQIRLGLKDRQQEFTIKCNILRRAQPYTTGARRCNLCLEENIFISSANKKTLLNKRTELISTRCHRKKVFTISVQSRYFNLSPPYYSSVYQFTQSKPISSQNTIRLFSLFCLVPLVLVILTLLLSITFQFSRTSRSPCLSFNFSSLSCCCYPRWSFPQNTSYFEWLPSPLSCTA